MISAKMPSYFWAHALQYVVHVHNRTPNRAIDFMTPFEMFTGKKPELKYIRRFGCVAYPLDKGRKPLTKFAPRVKRGFLLECNETGYTILDERERTLTKTKYVDFIESKVYGDCTDDDTMKNDDEIFEVEERKQTKNISGTDDQTEAELQEEEKLANLALEDGMEGDADPETYEEAMNDPDSAKWREAVNEELDSHELCGTWKLMKRSKLEEGTRVLKSRWVNRRKKERNGDTRYRSRLVVKGYDDRNDYDRTEVYAPVARMSDVRFLLSIANKYKMDLAQMDVKAAFLNGSLEKKVYMEIPDGVAERICEKVNIESFKRKYVCELKKALYGLKVSPKRWYLRFREAMIKMEFESYPFQSCLFFWHNDDEVAILLLYVDDVLIMTNSEKKLKDTKIQLAEEFRMTDLGEPKKFLGIEIKRNMSKGTIFLNQRKFVENILKRFKATNMKPADTPMVVYKNKNDEKVKQSEEFDLSQIPYRQAIGSLLYLANGTRPDIALAVNILSRRQSCYTWNDWLQIKRIFRYLAGTKDLGILYSGSKEIIEGFPDASLGLNDVKGQSTSGFAIFMFGDLISWRTKKQNHIALSSAEAEFVAMSLASREVTNVKEMCKRMLKTNLPSIMYEGNKAAIELAKTEESKTLKHIVNLCYHHVRKEVQEGRMELVWISTDDQIGDLFTKPLARSKFYEFRDKLVSNPDI